MTQITNHRRLCLALLGCLSLALCITSYAQAAAAPQSSDVPNGSSQRCATDNDCSPSSTFQTCYEGLCKCKSVSHYDPSIKSCRIFVGGTCNMLGGAFRAARESCVENAVCDSDVPLAAMGSCKCKKGYEENHLGLCVGDGSGSSQIGASVSLLFVTVGALVLRRL